ncbi:g2983 [Coccomyxa viridis]|uniref:G2983 protein n=1 Tax=Coccomyxa viridis TaxID=1274662 RepID=A0ABP1FTM8_9CHLO
MVGTTPGTTALAEGIPGLCSNVWNHADLKSTYPKLTENTTADVVVVGAGLTGLSIAYNLAKAGKNVVVLEARCVGAGQTGRSPGKSAPPLEADVLTWSFSEGTTTSAIAMRWNNDYLSQIEAERGDKFAQVVAESHKTAIDTLEQTIKAEGIECGWKRVDGYLFPTSSDQTAFNKLDGEMSAYIRAGQSDVRKVALDGSPAVGGIKEALLFPDCADLQPLAYVQGLAKAVEKLGGRIFENTRVMNTDKTYVKTKDGKEVGTPNIVLATSSPLHHNLAIHSRQHPYRSYIVGLRIPEDGWKEGQYWDTAKPFHYVRAVKDDKGLVLLVGGEDHNTGIKPKDYEDKYAILEAWARSRWSNVGERVSQWSREVYEPIDYLHLYGEDPVFPQGGSAKLYVATGDSSQEITGGTLAGMIISDQILGRHNRFSDVYSPSRPPALSKNLPGELWQVGKTVTQGELEVVNPGYVFTTISSIQPGEGAITQQGVNKVAVYKDETGKARGFKAACPHLGCLVQWNPMERTFDCPCHGSAFSREGICIQGPAKADLEEVEL